MSSNCIYPKSRVRVEVSGRRGGLCGTVGCRLRGASCTSGSGVSVVKSDTYPPSDPTRATLGFGVRPIWNSGRQVFGPLHRVGVGVGSAAHGAVCRGRVRGTGWSGLRVVR